MGGWYETMTGASSEMDSSTTEGVRLRQVRDRNEYKGRHILDGQENAVMMILQTVRAGFW